MSGTTWPAEWLRGVLPLCVLAAIAEKTMHGYAIARRLETAELGTVKGGTLYPILNRLERDGLVTSTWEAGSGGPGRRTFTITTQGRDALAEQRQAWHNFTTRAENLLTTTGEQS